VGFLLSGRPLVASENVRSVPVRFNIGNCCHWSGLNLAFRTKKVRFEKRHANSELSQERLGVLAGIDEML